MNRHQKTAQQGRAPAAGTTPAVILANPKYAHNVSAALRGCAAFDAAELWWTGSRVVLDETLGERLPREERMKGYRAVAMQRHDRPFDAFPRGTPFVAVEVRENSEPLTTFVHPEDAVYVCGPEDGSIPRSLLGRCHRFVHIQARHCLNLAVAVNLVLGHRWMQQQLGGSRPILPLSEILNEHRGADRPTPAMDALGWDGR